MQILTLAVNLAVLAVGEIALNSGSAAILAVAAAVFLFV